MTTIQEAKELILHNVIKMGWLEDKSENHLNDVELTLVSEDEKDRVHIHIIVKKKNYDMNFETKRNEKLYLDVAWDYIFFVDDDDVYVYPYEFLKRKDGKDWSMKKYMKDFKNMYSLINYSEFGLMQYLMDRKYHNA